VTLAIAIKATARKLAVQYWRLMNKGTEFVEKGLEAYESLVKEQKHLQKLAFELKRSTGTPLKQDVMGRARAV